MVITPEQFTYRGLIAPVLTPFNNDKKKSLNLTDITRYAKFLKDAGIEGILVNGTSGEGMSMNVEERKLVAEAWKKAASTTNLHLMIQVGGAPLPDVLELARHAESLGVDSIMTLPELYFKPKNPVELTHYLKLVSAAAPNTPLLYYHIPRYSGVSVHMGDFLNQVDGKIDTFVGIKFTSTVLDEGIAAVRAGNGRYAVFLGADDLMVGAYSLGFDSAIATSLNMWPKYGLNILKQVKDNNVNKALTTQKELSTAIKHANQYGEWVPIMKAAMNLTTPINVGVPRDPLLTLTPQQVQSFESDLRKLKFL
ncbi:N-acetylneuraminate lyase [Agrilus planipennis]|uniref:N-acetylneuraminate lyase n=1 Tax=Agrilus planipennis TaxID=224129 RepID=A0A7F5RCN5_AGRPL|nr:N-acetylneuraminate lyase [Agrilus planipennis]